MIDTYDKLIEEKKEIDYMMKLINHSGVFNNITLENKLRALIKHVIFFKQIYEFRDQGHFSKCMISDLLLLVNSLTKNSTKTFYMMYRSFIENFIRFLLEVKDDDNTGVRALFEKFRSEYCNKDTKELIDFIEGEYGKGCDFVHSNVNAKQNIFEYYKDLMESDVFKPSDLDKLTSVVLSFLTKSAFLLVCIKPEWVDQAFYRRKQLLQYLVNDKISNKLKELIEV